MKIFLTFLVIMLVTFIIYICLSKIYDKFEYHQIKKDDKKVRLFWTGGFDSTARLCQLLIEEKKTVYPLYIEFNLDNDDPNALWVRQNKEQEKDSMKQIRKALYKQFPYTKKLLKKTKFIKDKKTDPNYIQKFLEMNLFPKKRKIHQYVYLSNYAYKLKDYIEIGVLGIHQKSKFADFLKNNLIKEDENFKVAGKNPMECIKFPLYNKTKEDLYKRAKDNNYDNILNMSWSCWFPQSGKPCGLCPMCKERIVSHPESTTESTTESK